MVDTAQSAYHVLVQARDLLRTHLVLTGGVSEQTTINAEGTVSGHVAPDLYAADIMITDGRHAPQNAQWVAVAMAGSPRESLGLAVGTSRTTYGIMVACGLRSQTWRTDGGTQAVDTTDAGWLRAHLLARAAHTVIQRYLIAQTGIENVLFAGSTMRPQNRRSPDVYEVEVRFNVLCTTDNAALTA